MFGLKKARINEVCLHLTTDVSIISLKHATWWQVRADSGHPYNSGVVTNSNTPDVGLYSSPYNFGAVINNHKSVDNLMIAGGLGVWGTLVLYGWAPIAIAKISG